MNLEFNLSHIDSYKPTGRTKGVYKYVVSDAGRFRKYCSIKDIIADEDLKKYNLNRQKIFRIRSGEMRRPSAMIQYKNIKIISIKEQRPYKQLQVRVYEDGNNGSPFNEKKKGL